VRHQCPAKINILTCGMWMQTVSDSLFMRRGRTHLASQGPILCT
jgi:hypothetical protein